jgi:hypothetical protein
MSSLIGSGHTSDFREGSNREFEKSKGGSPTPRACHAGSFWLNEDR